MPRVPTYEQQVKTNALPGVRQNIQTTAADFGGAQAQALRQAGADIGKASDVAIAYAERKRKEDDEAKVWEAYIKLSDQERDYMYNPETGVMNRRGADAAGIAASSARDIGAMAEKISEGLANDAQKQAFRRMYARKLDSTLDSLARYETEQRRGYHDQLQQGVALTAKQDVEKQWNDPSYIDGRADVAILALRGNLLSKGTPKELIDAEAREMRSGFWKAALAQAIENDPFKAEQMLKENRDKMTGEDALAVEKTLEVPLRNAKGAAIAAQVASPRGTLPAPVSQLIVQEAVRVGVSPKVAMTIAKLENASGDPNAKNPNSSALGIYQFIDETWSAVGGTAADRRDMKRQVELGIKHIKENSESLRKVLGREPTASEIYLAHQQGLGGARALLGAGQGVRAIDVLTPLYGSVGRAINAIENNGGKSDMTAQEFVRQWDAKYQRRSGAMGLANMPLSEQIAAAKALAGDDIELQKVAIANVTTQYNQAKIAQAERIETASDNLFMHVSEKGTLNGANPVDLETVGYRKAREIEKAAANTTTNLYFYDEYLGMTPEEKKAVPLDKLLANLGGAERTAALKERNGVRSGQSKEPWLQTRGQMNTSYAREVGLIPESGKKLEKDHEAKYNAFSSYMNKRMDEYRAKHGYEMPEVEYRKEAGMALTRVVTQVNRMWPDEKARVYDLRGRSQRGVTSISDIPETWRADIETAIRKAGKKVDDKLVMDLASAWIAGDDEVARTLLGN